MSTFRLYFRVLFGTFLHNDRLFPEKYTVTDHISYTKLEKGDQYYFPHDLFTPVTKRFLLGRTLILSSCY